MERHIEVNRKIGTAMSSQSVYVDAWDLHKFLVASAEAHSEMGNANHAEAYQHMADRIQDIIDTATRPVQ